jgi:hypothetical protein
MKRLHMSGDLGAEWRNKQVEYVELNCLP